MSVVKRQILNLTQQVVEKAAKNGKQASLMKFRLQLKQALRRCHQQATLYKQCVKIGQLSTDLHECEKEFQQFKLCTGL